MVRGFLQFFFLIIMKVEDKITKLLKWIDFDSREDAIILLVYLSWELKAL